MCYPWQHRCQDSAQVAFRCNTSTLGNRSQTAGCSWEGAEAAQERCHLGGLLRLALDLERQTGSKVVSCPPVWGPTPSQPLSPCQRVCRAGPEHWCPAPPTRASLHTPGPGRPLPFHDLSCLWLPSSMRRLLVAPTSSQGVRPLAMPELPVSLEAVSCALPQAGRRAAPLFTSSPTRLPLSVQSSQPRSP